MLPFQELATASSSEIAQIARSYAAKPFQALNFKTVQQAEHAAQLGPEAFDFNGAGTGLFKNWASKD